MEEAIWRGVLCVLLSWHVCCCYGRLPLLCSSCCCQSSKLQLRAIIVGGGDSRYSNLENLTSPQKCNELSKSGKSFIGEINASVSTLLDAARRPSPFRIHSRTLHPQTRNTPIIMMFISPPFPSPPPFSPLPFSSLFPFSPLLSISSFFFFSSHVIIVPASHKREEQLRYIAFPPPFPPSPPLLLPFPFLRRVAEKEKENCFHSV